jgi:ABC-2 type transport system permease protein
MNNLRQAISVELLKARRSKMPLLTALGFLLVPFIGGFFMIVLKDPEMAQRMGIISAKAQIVAGEADWPTYLGLLAQATGIGGIILFSFIASWVFGREYSDHTIKDLLALPTPRSSLVAAKFVLVWSWSLLLVTFIYLVGLVVGHAVGLPTASAAVFWLGTVRVAITAVLTITLATPVAFFANAGRGYLPPMGFAIVMIVLAQVIAAAGWGEYFPWSVPALFAGLAGAAQAQLGIISYVIVAATSLAGAIGTFAWWELADQTH